MKIKPELREKVEALIERTRTTLATHLGISFDTYDTEMVVATMPVVAHTKQPFGLLHGGASVALAETLASVGAWLNVDGSKFSVAGMEINANHVRPVLGGTVTGIATPLHRGNRTQIWDIKITDENGKLVCVSRCTIAVSPLAST